MQTTRRGIVVVGSLNLDLLVRVPALPRPGQTVIGSSSVTMPGGKGANQAAAAAVLGGDVTMVGRVGDDAAAAVVLEDLRSRGVDVSAVTQSSGRTGTASVAVEPGGDNLIVVDPGANAALTPDDVEIDAVRDAEVVLLQLEVPLAAVRSAVAFARGVVVLNPAPPVPLPPEVLARVDVLVPNEGELCALAGRPDVGATTDDLVALVRRVTERDVVVTLGPGGALVVPASGAPVHVAAPSVEAVDATGAGDCFCGALCVALARGADLLTAARYATVAASLSTTGAGARGALPTDARVRAHRR